MAIWNLGSVATEIHTLVTVPAGISGAPLLRIVDRRRVYCEDFLNSTIGSNSIETKYHDPLIKFGIADVLDYTEDASSSQDSEYALGEFKVKKSSPSSEAIALWEDKGIKALKELRGRYHNYQSW